MFYYQPLKFWVATYFIRLSFSKVEILLSFKNMMQCYYFDNNEELSILLVYFESKRINCVQCCIRHQTCCTIHRIIHRKFHHYTNQIISPHFPTHLTPTPPSTPLAPAPHRKYLLSLKMSK